MLQASPELLPSLYDGRPKILVVKPRALSWTFVPPTNAICWLVAETSNGTDFILAGAHGGPVEIDWHPIELPPANVWAVWSPDGAVPLASLADWWSRVGGVGAEPIFVHGDAAMMSAALIERSLAEVDRLTQANQLLIEDLATLRESWAHDVRLPPELTELLANLRVAPPRLVFETPAANGDTGVPAAAAGGASTCGLRQRLPMGARGLLGIDLHVTAPGTGDGVLEVALVALEAEAELARWRMPYRELDAGWLPLRLPDGFDPYLARSGTSGPCRWRSGGAPAFLRPDRSSRRIRLSLPPTAILRAVRCWHSDSGAVFPASEPLPVPRWRSCRPTPWWRSQST